MKKMKKLVGILLTLAMVVAMSITTFAATTTYTITAPNNDHTYEIYQIFTGDLAEGVLSNVKWGDNGTGKVGEAVDDSILTELTKLNGNYKENLTTIEKYVDLDSTAYKTVKNKSVDVDAGYYLIKDEDDSLTGKNDTYTLYIVKVSANLTIEPKAEKPSSEKKVKDIND